MAKTTTSKGAATRVKGKDQSTVTVTGKLTPVTPTEEKVTDKILMLATDAEGVTFLVNKASKEFYVPLDDPNYAAMTSLLLSAHAANGMVAVKYTEPVIGIISNRRRATAIAKGVHAIISGGSF